MAITWKTVLAGVAVFSLCFLGIPVRIEPPNSNSSVLLQRSYVRYLQTYNRSYAQDTTDFQLKMTQFEVNS